MGETIALDLKKLKTLRLRIDTDDALFPGKKKLKIRGKDLLNLPPELFSLVELEVLDLSPEREACLYYRVTQVPKSIGRLVNLTTLMLDTNELADVPQEISLLCHLQGLALSNNHLTTIPDLSGLKELRSLHVANNEIEDFPLHICELSQLTFLDLSDNKIVAIPDNIANMKSLESLLLFINEIARLPEGICDLLNLRSLWIGQNKIRRLPRKFAQLKHLDWGYRHTYSPVMDGNPLQHPPIEICKKGVAYIERYFQQAEPERKT